MLTETLIGEKSPHWDERSEAIKALSAGQNLPGFPFSEDWPWFFEGRIYEIILGNGVIDQAVVDVSPNHVSDNKAWKTLDGPVHRDWVAGWRRMKEQVDD